MVARRNDEIATTAGDARSRADAAAAAVTALPKTAPAPAPPPSPPAVLRSEVEALANRVTALEQAAKALQAELAKRAAADAGDRVVRVAVSAAILQSTVERGDPFAKELAAAKALAGDAKALASLGAVRGFRRAVGGRAQPRVDRAAAGAAAGSGDNAAG